MFERGHEPHWDSVEKCREILGPAPASPGSEDRRRFYTLEGRVEPLGDSVVKQCVDACKRVLGCWVMLNLAGGWTKWASVIHREISPPPLEDHPRGGPISVARL